MKSHVAAWCKVALSTLPLVAVLALGPIGCSNSSLGPLKTDPAHAGTAVPELNEGQKWVVAKPMIAHVRNLEKAVQDFDKTPGQSHQALASDIQDHLGRLVTNCTMEGKAHDELHKWLMPFLGLSAAYSSATDPQAQQHQLQEIKQALVVFNEYFQ